jgi:hypothetical protein
LIQIYKFSLFSQSIFYQSLFINYVQQRRSGKNKKRILDKFWEVFPRKWILYDTKIKDFAFKFYCDNKKAEVSLDIEIKDEIFRNAYYEKLWSLESILEEELKCELYKDEFYTLENGKVISRFWVEKHGVSIYNKNTWQEIFEFFVENVCLRTSLLGI